jgi:hypothetical protein
MSRVDALDVVVTSVGGKVGAGATAATSTTQGEVNVSGVLTGIAQSIHSGVDLATKGLQAVPGSAWAKGVPLVGSGLGALGLWEGRNPTSQADYAGLLSNGATIGAGVALTVFGAPVVATGLGVVAIGAGGYQIYSTVADRPANASYSNEGRNYKTPSYNFGPNYRGNGFTDPRILDNSGGYRGLNAYSGVYASQAAENAAFERDWNTAVNAYSMEPSYSSFPTDPAAYNGYADAFGNSGASSNGASGWHDFQWEDSFEADWNAAQDAYTGSQDWSSPSYDSYYDYSYDYSYDSYDYGGWWPLVIDLDGDGVEIKPLDSSTTYFDLDADGYKERTAWVGADDGLMVIDLNNDGQITQSKEMAFGEWTTEQDTDLQALAKVFDSNQDGTFDSRDARFAEFRIWKDANSNGVADAGEMMTLQAAGIASIATTVKDGTTLDLSDGSSIAGLFKVQRTDGKLVDGADVAFAYQKTGVKETVDAQGNKVFAFEGGDVYKHMVMSATQTNVTLPDNSGTNWIGVTGNALNDALYRRRA